MQAWVVENERKEETSHDKERQVLIDGLKKLSADVAEIAALLEGAEAPTKKQDAPVEETSPAATEEAPAKVYTYEEVRAILAEKSRTGFRAEVKAILTAHGVKQLSDVQTPEEFAAIVAEAEVIGNG